MEVLKQAKELRKLWGGFWPARVLLTANNFGIFDYLKSPKTAIEIAKSLKTDSRATEILLDALTGLGLLKKSGNKYKNTLTANRFLIKESPYYHGDIIKHADTLWKNWSGLDEIIKTGRPNRSAHDHEAFIKGMHNIASLKAKDVIKAIDLKGVKKALDLGGGPGTYSIEMAKKGVLATLFDVPETIKIAKEIIISTGKYVGIGIANLINIFNPELCIIGGGVSLAGEILFKEILKYAQINTLPRAWDVVSIEQAKLGNKAGILGSAALAFMKTK